MLRELDSLHETILGAFKAVSLLTGVDLEPLVAEYGDGSTPDPPPSHSHPLTQAARHS